MKNKGMRTVKITDLLTNLFVRKELNHDHVLYLAELIENGVKMRDPIEVTDRDGKMNIVVEGRHRIEAYTLNNVAEVEVRVLEFASETEMIAHAYKANAGGSLPPTPQDTEHTIWLLLESGETVKRIGELLRLPTGMARKYVNLVRSKAARKKLMAAVNAVTDDNMTIIKAAEKHEVDPTKLREMLSGKKKPTNRAGVNEIQRALTKTYRSLGQKNASLFRSLREQYEDGDVSNKQLANIFTHIERLTKLSARAIADWKKRFKANGKGTEES